VNSHPLGRVEARKFAHCFCVGINFSFARAIGATQEAHFISYCRLLPPRQSAKLLEGNRVTGSGRWESNPDALRVRNDLRRTIRDLHVATLLQANDLAFSRSDCRLQPPRKSRKCSDDNKIDCVGRGIQTHEPLYFNGLPGTAPNYKFNADKTTNRIATGNNRNNQGKSCPEVDQTSQYKRVCGYKC